MASKIEWGASDHAAQEILAGIMHDSGLSYRAMESQANAGISYTRFHDIANGRRAPVRLTEFLAICDVCGADPVETMRRIMCETARIRAARDSPTPASAVDFSDDEARIEETKRRAFAGDMNLAANMDPNKQHYIDGDGIGEP